MGYFIKPKQLYLGKNFEPIPNVFKLDRVGAGHDGFVYRDGGVVYKVLKHGIDERKEKGLMSFDKARYLQELDVKRFIKPSDFLIDEDGCYAGYVMPFYEDLTKDDSLPTFRKVGDFTCGDFIRSVNDLEDDVAELTRRGVSLKDLNRGSYIFASDFLHLCDMDKYQISRDKALRVNWEQLNFIIAKLMYFEKMEREGYFRGTEEEKEINRKMNEWVKKSTNARKFTDMLRTEVGRDYGTPLREFTDFTFQKVIG